MNNLLTLILMLGTSLLSLAQKHDLFIISVGVSDYKSSKIKDLKYADKDAKDLADLFKKQTDLFEIRKASILTNKEATRENIKKEFESLKGEITPNDLFIFIFSGHGKEEALITHEYDSENLRTTSIIKDELREFFDKYVNCSYLVFLDACHSGSFRSNSFGKGLKDVEVKLANEKLNNALNSATKANFVISSSSSNELSDECKSCENGYFTQRILDAFDGRIIEDKKFNKKYTSVDNNSNFIYVSKLAEYLQETVVLTTKNNPLPQTVIVSSNAGINFPIGIVSGERIVDPIKPDPIKISKNAFAKSLVFPGWGDKVLDPNSHRKWMGVLSYGTLAGGFFMQKKSQDFLKKYNLGFKQSEINTNRDQTILNDKIGNILWGVSAAIWTIDLTLVSTKKNSNISFSSEGIGLAYKF